MASPSMPMPGGAPPSPGGAPGAPPPGLSAAASAVHDQNSPTQDLIKLNMDAQKIAQDNPATAPMMKEIGNQVRLATMKMIQARQQQQQATPQI